MLPQHTPTAIAHRFGFSDWPSYFWSKVDRSGGLFACWPWAGRQQVDGYGELRYGGRARRAHRMAWELTYGPIPKGRSCLHRCDVRHCCNPAHLFLGTQAENVADMLAKGRGTTGRIYGDTHWTRAHPDRVPCGEANHNAKLTDEQVREIRRRYAAGGISQPALAREYGVTHALIGGIVRYTAWTHVPPEPGVAPPVLGHRRLTEHEVRTIHALHQGGRAGTELARQFGMRPSAIYRILRRKTWAHVAVETVLPPAHVNQPSLTAEQVRVVRSRYAEGVSMYQLAREFGVGHSTIFSIVHRRTYKHVD